jgi:hypothetical protein
VTNPKHSIPRAKSATSISTAAQTTKNFPGAGHYFNKDDIGSMASLVKKSSRRVIHPYKAKRYFDQITKNAKFVPGPGTYEIGPKPKKNIKY